MESWRASDRPTGRPALERLTVDDIARRALRQIEHGHDGGPGQIVATGLREGGSTPARG